MAMVPSFDLVALPLRGSVMWRAHLESFRCYVGHFVGFLKRALGVFVDSPQEDVVWRWSSALLGPSAWNPFEEWNFVDSFSSAEGESKRLSLTPPFEEQSNWTGEATPWALLSMTRVHVENALELCARRPRLHLSRALAELPQWGIKLGRAVQPSAWVADCRPEKELVMALRYLESTYLPQVETMEMVRSACDEHPGRRDLGEALFLREAVVLDPAFGESVMRLCCLALNTIARDLAEEPDVLELYSCCMIEMPLHVLEGLWRLMPRCFGAHLELLRETCVSLLRLLGSLDRDTTLIDHHIVALLHVWSVEKPLVLDDGTHLFDCDVVAKWLHRRLWKYAYLRAEDGPELREQDRLFAKVLAFVWERPHFRKA